jgi:hypothetical protein
MDYLFEVQSAEELDRQWLWPCGTKFGGYLNHLSAHEVRCECDRRSLGRGLGDEDQAPNRMTRQRVDIFMIDPWAGHFARN